MSHFIFGCFNSAVLGSEITDELKKIAQKKDVFIWFEYSRNFTVLENIGTI